MAGYVQLIQESEFVQTNRSILKISSTQTRCSLPRGSRVIYLAHVPDYKKAGERLVEKFDSKFTQCEGRKSYEGDIALMAKEFAFCVFLEHNRLFQSDEKLYDEKPRSYKCSICEFSTIDKNAIDLHRKECKIRVAQTLEEMSERIKTLEEELDQARNECDQVHKEITIEELWRKHIQRAFTEYKKSCCCVREITPKEKLVSILPCIEDIRKTPKSDRQYKYENLLHYIDLMNETLDTYEEATAEMSKKFDLYTEQVRKLSESFSVENF